MSELCQFTGTGVMAQAGITRDGAYFRRWRTGWWIGVDRLLGSTQCTGGSWLNFCISYLFKSDAVDQSWNLVGKVTTGTGFSGQE